MKKDPVEIFAIGGAGEFGRNCVLVRTLFKAVVVDCGIGMVNDEVPGVTKVLPDLDFLYHHRHELLAILVTHGHEDHIGAIPRALERVNVPVYASEYTARLMVERARTEFGMDIEDRVRVVEPWRWYELDPDVRFKFLPLPHSIPHSGAILVEMYGRRVLHTGDYKLADDGLTTFEPERWRTEALDEPIFAMIGDSTGALEPGETRGEAEVRAELFEMMSSVKGRILITLFSSNIQRIRTILSVARSLGRKVAMVGRSMEMYFSIAEELHLVSKTDVIPLTQLMELPAHQQVVLVAGSQAEDLSALNRASWDEHRTIEISEGDTVIFSSRPIPGRERQIHEMMDRLSELGADVVDIKMLPRVHVSGHPASGDVRRLIDLVRPSWYVPFHGGYRFMKAGAKIAESLGIRTAMFTTGQWLRLHDDRYETEEEELRTLYIGLTEDDVMDEGAVEMRRAMTERGLAVVSLVLDKTGVPVERPSVVLMGFGTAGERAQLADSIARRINMELRMLGEPKRVSMESFVSGVVKSEVRKRFGSSPMVIVTVGGCMK